MPAFFELAARHRRLAVVLFGCAVLLYLALLCTSAATRKPWNDEAMSADAGYNLAFKGYDGVGFYDDNFYGPGVKKHSYYIFPFQLYVLAAWYHLVPFTTFFTRFLSILWNCALLAGLYHLIRKLIDDRAIALLAVVLTAGNYQMITSASFGRYDMMVAALGFCSYAVYMLLRERSLRWAIFLANALVVASGATHPNGIFYFVGLWFLIGYYDRKRVKWVELGIAILPYLIGGALWAAYIFQDYASFHRQIVRNSAGRIGLLHPWQNLVLEFQKRLIPVFGLGPHSAGHDSPIVRLKAFALLAFAFGIAVCLFTPAIRRNSHYTSFLCLTGIHWFLMTFSETMKFSYYLVHLIPLFCGVLALAVTYLWRLQKVPRWVLAGGVAVLLILEIGGIAARIRLNDYQRVYTPAVEFLKHTAQPDDEVFAACSLGFDYGFDKIIDDDTLGYYSSKHPRFIVMEEIFDYQHALMKNVSPEKYAHVRQMLDSYKLVYHNSEYRVYERQ